MIERQAQRVREMRQSIEQALTLLRSYDAVIGDVTDSGIRHDGITCSVLRERRNQLDSDIRRLRGEVSSLEHTP